MSMPLHMTIEGKKQGAIDGPCTMKGREKTFLVNALNHEVFMPRSPQTGLSTGKRVHNPLSIVKEIDQASPKLYMALTNGEHLTVTIKWYRTNPAGGAAEQHYFTTLLENAILVSVRPWVPNTLDPNSRNYTHHEEISITYERISWTFEPGGVSSTDDWQAPVEG